MKILNRNSTTINIATFWENFQLNKYNFDPSYQRKSDVWSESKKSFLIDTILKNFPIPPIFLHQHIDETSGKTMYDVIDGKQRLTSILDFIANKINTPEDFHSDGFGSEDLSNINFKDLDKPELTDWKKVFWRYDITVEYIDTDVSDIVNNIFDRLNRNGEPLTKQELRNAKFNDSNFLKLVKILAGNETLKPILDKLQRNRLEDEEFIIELLLTSIEDEIKIGDKPEIIDEKISQYSKSDSTQITSFEKKFMESVEILSRLNLDYKKLKVEGVSHIYALWGLTVELLKENKIEDIDYENLKTKVEKFYTEYLLKSQDPNIKIYKSSMSAGTKSFYNRNRRIKSLVEYCKS
ncbi:DUF262 domain-containing protein [Flavobacterium sp. N1736]|uniref:DUF262 domain-containing protein n=1 Tax=Flavobacterium sp. N1736 TaxID=2986823 RepID=UPI002224EA8B|nr:DUF262 domain-containing protein [Flavobacterium sp. N1736]